MHCLHSCAWLLLAWRLFIQPQKRPLIAYWGDARCRPLTLCLVITQTHKNHTHHLLKMFMEVNLFNSIGSFGGSRIRTSDKTWLNACSFKFKVRWQVFKRHSNFNGILISNNVVIQWSAATRRSSGYSGLLLFWIIGFISLKKKRSIWTVWSRITENVPEKLNYREERTHTCRKTILTALKSSHSNRLQL